MLDVVGCDFARIQYAGHHFRKMSIYIIFECLNIRMPIRIYCSFGQLFLSFLQNGFAKWRDSRTNNRNYQKWQKEIDRWSLIEGKPCLWDIFFERVQSSPSAIVKAKINALRARLGPQMAKNRKQKVIRQQTKIILPNIMETLTQTNPTCCPNI